MVQWYVLQSKPQKESLLNEQLCLHEIETWYPCLQVNPVNPRSRKSIPYFPGYLFIHVDLNAVEFSKIQWLPGVSRVVSFGGEPASVSDALIQSIRRQIDGINSAGDETFQKIKHGDIVSIHSGPFAGYRAIFDSRLKGNERVRVLLQMLQDRQICVELSGSEIESIQ